jgi:hypothetical protein
MRLAQPGCAAHHQMNENGTQIGALALDLHDLFFLCALCASAVYLQRK